MAGKKRRKSKNSPLHYGPSLLLLATGIALGIVVLILVVHDSLALL